MQPLAAGGLSHVPSAATAILLAQVVGGRFETGCSGLPRVFIGHRGGGLRPYIVRPVARPSGRFETGCSGYQDPESVVGAGLDLFLGGKSPEGYTALVPPQMVCVICVYGPQTGRAEAEKEAFREEVERLAGLSDGQTMLCVAGDFNAHIGVVEPGDEESIGRFGWGTRNREGRELVEMLSRNGLAVAGTFFQKKESHKITYRSGRHNTELDLLVVRQQQLRRVKDCKSLPGEYVTTQHKPVVFEVRMQKWKEKRTMGRNNIKWWKCNDEMVVEYMERVRRKYEELDTEKGTMEGEWRQYKDAFVGVAEELCGRTSGKGGTPRSRNQGWWTEELAKAVHGGEAGSMEDDRMH